MKFKKSKKFRNTSVEADVLQTWIKYWSGQAAFVALQLWFTKKLETVFMGAESRKRITESKRRKRGQISEEESDEYQSVDDIELSS